MTKLSLHTSALDPRWVKINWVTTGNATPLSSDQLRSRMVDQLTKDSSFSAAVAHAFRVVPRHVFLPGIPPETVYSGAVVATRFDAAGKAISSSSEVALMAHMLEALALDHGLRVLEIGTGTGYNAAILAELVGRSGRVTTIEIDDAIAGEARNHLITAGSERVSIHTADGWLGYASEAPYDRIEVTAAVADLSPDWVDQLVDGGLLCVPMLFRPTAFAIPVFRKEGDHMSSVAVVQGGFMHLRGIGAPPDGTRQVGDWRYTSGRPVDEVDEEKLGALLGETPSIEVSGDWNWTAIAMLAMLEPNAITLARGEHRPPSIGLFDGEGVAVIEGAGGNVAGMKRLLVGLGARSTLDRLRDRLAMLANRSWSDLRITAVRTGSPLPAGTQRIERPNYSFGMTLGR